MSFCENPLYRHCTDDAHRLPRPYSSFEIVLKVVLRIRAFVLKYLALPRFRKALELSSPDPRSGRIYHYRYVKEPWYNPPSFRTRWGLTTIIVWLTGGMRPGDGGEHMKPNGFLFTDLGPRRKMGKGLQGFYHEDSKVRVKSSLSCPFEKGE